VGTINALYWWTDQLLFWGLLALRLWALVDCLTRKVAAFPAVDKLSKAAWVAMLLFGAFFGSVVAPAPTGPISLITAIIATVYLADVRPAVREISGGKSR
jgi:O-antigen ligase